MKIEEINVSQLVRLSSLKETATAIINGEYEDPKDQADSVLKNIVDAYAELSRKQLYAKAVASGNPMHYLCKEFQYPTIVIRESDEDGKSVQDSFKKVNLLHANKEISGGIGADRSWVYRAENLNFDLTLRQAKRAGDGVFESTLKKNPTVFRMHENARKISEGRNPLSDKAIHAELEGVIQAMIGREFHISVHDRNILFDTFAKNGKTARTVTAANHRGTCESLMNICNRILSGETGYILESKNIKKS